jgi:hypothetical protein
LCIVLALLFLYNPFVVASPSGTLTVQHTPSYRATIASSELQNFSPIEPSRIFAIAIVLVFAWLLCSARVHFGRLGRTLDVVASPCRLMSSSLWFRPPPSL